MLYSASLATSQISVVASSRTLTYPAVTGLVSQYKLNGDATSITFTAICTTNSSTITGSCVVDVAASGTCHFTPATASVTNVPPGTYTWEVCVVYPTKTLTPIGSANIVVQQKY